MVRFKVIRASHLLLGMAIVLLVAVLALVGAKLFAPKSQPPSSGSASLVDAGTNDEAKTAVVFASSAAESRLPLDPLEGGIEIEVLTPTEAPEETKRILIYHTHTHEAYEQVSEDPYEALEAWRTTDVDHSVVRVGEELAQALRQHGFRVTHDITDHEGEALSTAYTRSLKTLESYDETFDLYIDLHRDAYLDGEPIAVKASNGEDTAPVMFLIGNGNGFDVKPWYEENLAFANVLRARLEMTEPGLCKPVLVKDGRYNQHIGVFSILIEVGHNRNTLRQALNAVNPLAAAIFSVLADSPDPELVRIQSAWRKAHAAG